MGARNVFVLVFWLVCQWAVAQQPLTVAGSYKYVPDPAQVDYCKKKKIPAPKGEIVLRDDFTFTLTINDQDGVHRTQGRYALEKDLVRFTVEDGDGNELPHLMRASKRGLNGRGAAFTKSLVLPRAGTPVAAIPEPVVEQEGPAVDPTKLLLDQIQGVWTVYRNEKEDRTIRFSITGNKWRYNGVGVSSAGELELDAETRCFVMIYRQIDGQPIEAGLNMRKRVSFAEDGSGFVIEGCQYRKASKP